MTISDLLEQPCNKSDINTCTVTSCEQLDKLVGCLYFHKNGFTDNSCVIYISILWSPYFHVLSLLSRMI